MSEITLTWEILTVIGVVAFAVSGSIAAMEERYDVLGIIILGLVTAFGGGGARNLLLGIPISNLWEQSNLFIIAILSSLFVFFLPNLWFHYIKQWMFFDAVGLAAFSIQGALFAVDMNLPIIAVVVAALLTGSGGGIIRDVLAGRKPLIFRDEIYGLWAMLAGLVIGLGIVSTPIAFYIVFLLVVVLRMLSVYYGLRLPKKPIYRKNPK
ncbi:trimeric intracellular cation channel family protein [Chengkuizengella axinellae]|uniref:Trimeric intracellular cation channel family protein n=1 Tax=Chengkuizengella axinellae TaxID=3064388 RepID=A0ABT9IXA7_9BACL|nr:trimeric intracellular cation channel family protein [Chengkuizengella sp. 2205SS18-9]MDP5273982.1 trimeric intracellular cation channel family protein [Chengkuizengella sp. 2205SS18-9]